MAKTKKGRKKVTYRRRRVGAGKLSPQDKLVKIGAAAAGFLLADQINEQIDKVVPANIDPKIVSFGQTGIGAALLLMKGGGNDAMGWVKTGAGGLLAGSGLKRVLKEMNIIKGFSQVPVLGRAGVAGYGQVQTLAGYTTPGTLGAYDVPRRPSVMGSVALMDAATSYSVADR